MRAASTRVDRSFWLRRGMNTIKRPAWLFVSVFHFVPIAAGGGQAIQPQYRGLRSLGLENDSRSHGRPPLRGVNLVEIMYFPATSEGPRPPLHFMGELGFPDLMHYVRQLSYLMSMGRPAASVALYVSTSSSWLGDAVANRDFVATG